MIPAASVHVSPALSRFPSRRRHTRTPRATAGSSATSSASTIPRAPHSAYDAASGRVSLTLNLALPRDRWGQTEIVIARGEDAAGRRDADVRYRDELRSVSACRKEGGKRHTRFSRIMAIGYTAVSVSGLTHKEQREGGPPTDAQHDVPECTVL